MKRWCANLALVLVSLLLAAAGGELLLRLLPRPQDSPVPLNRQLLQELAERYVQERGVVRRQWFFQDPPPAAEGMPLRYDFRREGRRLFDRRENLRLGTNFPKVFNFWQVKRAICAGEGEVYTTYPFPLEVFPPDPPMPFPRYRFYPYARYASGLVTNRYGYRGPDFPPAKPPGVVRIAFLGGSTTVNHPRMRASYPEFVGFWLNRWARAKGLRVRFQVLNAARDGATSRDLSGVVLTELRFLNPDLIVYYEGCNQFNLKGLIELPPGESLGRPLFAHRREATQGAWAWLCNHFHLFRRISLAWRLVRDRFFTPRFLPEPPKPKYELRMPPSVDEGDPDPDNPQLPLSLPQIVRDLKTIARFCRENGQLFVLCSFVWLARDGMVIDREKVSVDPIRDWYMGGVYGYLNWKYWPVRYADLRRLADFQNRVYRNFARRYGVHFLDVARTFPQDYRLFFDGVHMTEEGVRLRAWLVFLGLKDLLEPLLSSGKLPLPPRQGGSARGIQPPWPVGFDVGRLDCRPASLGSCRGIPLDLKAFRAVASHGRIRWRRGEEGGELEVLTGRRRYAYAAELPLSGVCPRGPFWLEFDLQVDPGSRVSLGVLSPERDRFVASRNQAATQGAYLKVYLSVPAGERAGWLMVSNAQTRDGRRSLVRIRGIRLYCPSSCGGRR